MLDTGADAVIVGSAFTNVIDQSNDQEMANKIETLARSLKSVTK
jgi:tryptophan synthase alpha subunit